MVTKWSHWLDRPRLLAGLALLLALIPAWVAVATFREAREQNQGRFEADVNLQHARLQDISGDHFYMLSQTRNAARRLTDSALNEGSIQLPNFRRQEQVPHLIAYGYAERMENALILRWRSEALSPVSGPGEDLQRDPRVATLLHLPPPSNPSSSIGCMLDRHQFFTLVAVPKLPPDNGTRGYIVGWIDLDSLCRDERAPLVRDHMLVASPLGADGKPAKDTISVSIRDDEGAAWSAAIARGPNFDTQRGPAPWIAVIAAGASAVPMLVLSVLAARTAKLRGDLAAEREQLRQQRFFTQSVSHEFRTPLSIILSGADLLENYADKMDAERKRQVFDEIKSSTRQMNEMVERVLLLGRIESNRAEPKPKTANLAEFCEETARRIRTATNERCRIEVTAADEETMIDPVLAGTILENLLSNAVKYSAAGSSVNLTASVEGDRVTFIVRDEGIGIPADQLERVGEMFFRSGNVGDAPGSGLGLTIAQRCAALLGGTLKLESTESRGTTVTVSLPTARASS